jgi:hypothetical protein
MVMVVLAGGVSQGAEIDASFAGEQVAIPADKIDKGDVVFRAAGWNLLASASTAMDILVVETRPDGHAATGELVLVTIETKAFIGRWWTKHGRRELLDDVLSLITDDERLQVIGAITVIMRTTHGARQGDDATYYVRTICSLRYCSFLASFGKYRFASETGP